MFHTKVPTSHLWLPTRDNHPIHRLTQQNVTGILRDSGGIWSQSTVVLTLAHTMAHLKASIVGFHGYIRGVKAECCSVRSRPALLSMCSLSQYEWEREWTLEK